MTAQQQTDLRRAHAASLAAQARIRRENAAHNRRQDLSGKTLRQIAAQQQQKKGAP